MVFCNPPKTCLIPPKNEHTQKGTVASLEPNKHNPAGGWGCGGSRSGCFAIGGKDSHGHGCCNKGEYKNMYKCVGDAGSSNPPFRCEQND